MKARRDFNDGWKRYYSSGPKFSRWGRADRATATCYPIVLPHPGSRYFAVLVRQGYFHEYESSWRIVQSGKKSPWPSYMSSTPSTYWKYKDSAKFEFLRSNFCFLHCILFITQVKFFSGIIATLFSWKMARKFLNRLTLADSCVLTATLWGAWTSILRMFIFRAMLTISLIIWLFKLTLMLQSW